MPGGAGWRVSALSRLSDETFDVLVVGGGATGAAIARDAVLRGLRVALCEYGDFASQTSSQSSKLIHGGLRYLQYGDLPLVFEGLAERRRLLETAPHLCRPIEFLFPAYRHHRPSKLALRVGISLYNALALYREPAQSRHLDESEVYAVAPALRSAGLVGAETYTDCQTDDARLVLENILDAEGAGAVVASYVEVRAPSAPKGHLRAITAVDRQTGESFVIRARAVVNAGGPVSDSFAAAPPLLRPTLGVHVVFEAERLSTSGRAIVINSPRDGRLIFTLPAGTRTIVGTTDTDFRPGGQDRPPRLGDEIRARAADVDYLLEAANHAFPPAALTRADVLSTYAGLRPLVAADKRSTSATSREHEIWIDRNGVLTVSGGKLTTMRRMGEEAVDRLADLLRDRGFDRALGPCVTRTRRLPGAATGNLDAFELAPEVREHLLRTYGGRASMVAALAHSDRLAARLVPGLPYLRAEVLFAIRHDLVCDVDDVLRRRLSVFRDAPDQGLAAAEFVADQLAEEYGWTPGHRERSIAAYRGAVQMSRRWRNE